MNYKNKLTVVSVMMSSFVLFTGGAVVRAVEPKPIPVSKVTASSSSGAYTPEKAVDGIINDDSRWVAKGAGSPMWIELKLDGPHKIAGLHLYSGYKNGAPVRQFVVQFWGDGKWQDVPSAVFENNWDTALAIAFDATVTVNTDRLRLLIKGESARVQEIMVWAGENGAIPSAPCRSATAMSEQTSGWRAMGTSFSTSAKWIPSMPGTCCPSWAGFGCAWNRP